MIKSTPTERSRETNVNPNALPTGIKYIEFHIENRTELAHIDKVGQIWCEIKEASHSPQRINNICFCSTLLSSEFLKANPQKAEEFRNKIKELKNEDARNYNYRIQHTSDGTFLHITRNRSSEDTISK